MKSFTANYAMEDVAKIDLIIIAENIKDATEKAYELEDEKFRLYSIKLSEEEKYQTIRVA